MSPPNPKSTRPPPSVENETLDKLIGKRVKVFITSNNVALLGTLKRHDRKVLVLTSKQGEVLVYKRQIISLTPGEQK